MKNIKNGKKITKTPHLKGSTRYCIKEKDLKHRKIYEVHPYTYYLKNIITGQKYHGVRWANVRANKTPVQDFGIRYFTSGKLSKDFRENPELYVFSIRWTFDDVNEACDYETKVNTKLMRKKDWEVWSNSKSIINKVSPSLGRKVKGTEIAKKIGEANKGKVRTDAMKQQMSSIMIEKVEANKHYWQTTEHSENTSLRMKENNPSKNGLSKEHKTKIGEAQRGKPKPPFSEEHKKNLSKSNKGKTPWNKGKRGVYKCSEETRMKMSEAKKGRTHSEETRAKMKLNAKGTFHLQGKKISCLCCKREWDLGNYTKHLRKGKK